MGNVDPNNVWIKEDNIFVSAATILIVAAVVLNAKPVKTRYRVCFLLLLMNRGCRTHAGPCRSYFSGEEFKSFLLFVVDGHPDHCLSGALQTHTDKTDPDI